MRLHRISLRQIFVLLKYFSFWANVMTQVQQSSDAGKHFCHNIWTLTAIYNLLFSPAAGIDGPAAFLGSDAPDLGKKIQILSVSQPQCQSQPQSQSQSQPESQSQSQSPTAEEPERDGDTDTLLEPKTDIHELLQKQGESRQRLEINFYDVQHWLFNRKKHCCFSWRSTTFAKKVSTLSDTMKYTADLFKNRIRIALAIFTHILITLQPYLLYIADFYSSF